jgi:hypothetical protein
LGNNHANVRSGNKFAKFLNKKYSENGVKLVEEPRIENYGLSVCSKTFMEIFGISWGRNMTDEKPPSKSCPDINARELEFLKYVGTELTFKEIADKCAVAREPLKVTGSSVREAWCQNPRRPGDQRFEK